MSVAQVSRFALFLHNGFDELQFVPAVIDSDHLHAFPLFDVGLEFLKALKQLVQNGRIQPLLEQQLGQLQHLLLGVPDEVDEVLVAFVEFLDAFLLVVEV